MTCISKSTVNTQINIYIFFIWILFGAFISSLILKTELCELFCINISIISSNFLREEIYAGGSLSIPASLYDLVADFRFSTSCDCGKFKSESDIRIAPSGYWISFTALLMHSRLFHSGQPGKNLLYIGTSKTPL